MKVARALKGSSAASLSLAVCVALVALGRDGCGEEFVDVNAYIEVTPATVAFGAVPVGTASEQLVDVRNFGRADLLIAAIKVTENDAEIRTAREWATNCDGSPRPAEGASVLKSGECARFAVRIFPTERHPVAGKLTIESNAGNEPSLEVPVTGEGTVPSIRVCVVNHPSGEIEPSNCTKFAEGSEVIPELDFGPVPMGDERVRQLALFNDGYGPLIVTEAIVEGEATEFAVAGGTFSGTVLAGPEPKKIDYVFRPEGDGPTSAIALIPTNDPNHPALRVKLKAEAQGPKLCVDPDVGLDFGNIVVGQERKLSIKFSNCGYVPYDITKFDFAEDDRTVAEYTTTTLPRAPIKFEAGDDFTIEVTYRPTRVHGSAESGDVAFFSIITDYQRGNIPVKGKGASPGCDGGVTPTADIRVFAGSNYTTNITSNPQREPLDTVQLDGSTSTVRAGGTPTFVWRIASQPAGGNTGLISVTGTPAGSKKRLFLELSGDYLVELVVKDQYGCQSAPKTITVKSISSAKLHLQLTWPQSFGDVDLHYLGPGGTFYGAGDTYWLAKHPDWGRNNTITPDGNAANDPDLDIDDLWGNGPENIHHSLPFDGTYRITVHYFCSRSNGSSRSLGAAVPVLKVFVNGTKAYEATKSLTQRDVWEAAIVTVSNNGTDITVAPSPVAVRKTTAFDQGCGPETN